MKLASRGLLLLWMFAALWGGTLVGYFLRFATALVGASLGLGREGAGLVALWTLRVVGVVAIWLGAGRAIRWWPVLSRGRLAIGALGGFLAGALLGYVLETAVGGSEGNVVVSVALLGYGTGVLVASARGATGR